MGLYTQVPGSNPLAGRQCGLVLPFTADDLTLTVPGQAAFYLTTGVAAGVESSLGTNSAGIERPNTNPCP